MQQAITWANVDLDLCPQMASLGPNELIHYLVAGGFPWEQPSLCSS